MRIIPALQLLAAAVAPIQAAFTWKNVKIGGGGGFVPGIVFHPTAKGVAYARTDIGGLYKLNSDDSWTAVTDSLATNAGWSKLGVDAVALDPKDPNKVYAATGLYTNSWDPDNGSIVRSSDKGATWSVSTLPFKVGGNMPGRGLGERLAVDPNNGKILFFGARSGNGLWKSTDGGVTFSKVTSFTAVGTFAQNPADTTGYQSDIQGLTWVTFDPTSPVLPGSGATSRIFVGTADNITASVYVTNDGGSTWAPVAGQPKAYFPHKAKIQPAEKALYVTYADGTGPFDGTKGAVYRYDLAKSTWKDITPVSGADLTYGFGGLGVDMLKPGTLVVASLNSWWPDAQIFRSTDSGATWSRLWEWAAYPEMHQYYSIRTSKAPWIETGHLSQDSKRLGWMIESLEINPTDSDHWLYGTGLTVFGGHDLTKWDTVHNITIQSLADGIEETAVLELASAPGGSELLIAIGDITGFTYKTSADLFKSPARPWMAPKWATSSGVDYAGAKPNSVVRVGQTQGEPMLAASSDGGASWSVHPGANTNYYGGVAALSADASVVLWATANGAVVRSQNQGAFAAVSGLPSSLPGTVSVAADKRRAGVFYVASSGAAALYVSTDAGATFARAAGSLSPAATGVRYVTAHPAVAGAVFVSTDAGVFRSADSGATFAPVASGLTDAQHIALGLGAGGSSWTLYALGSGPGGQRRLHASADAGAGPWVDIQGAAQGFGRMENARLAGSGNVPGQVYVGTNGRGVFVAQGSVGGGGGGTGSTTLVTSTTTSATTTSKPMTTSMSTSSSARPTTTGGGGGPTVPRYGQCGGIGYGGPTVCAAPHTCTKQNDWYWQCL
ncbi:xyloglucanase [Gaeumannomyces tritici R3-111a-1]|uniref:Xyloglucanase n=1 Tax=Gaeumannomyces tritici (strain R3-111a-1) TaxID=644352 RepID=J3NFV8_GAET3|nr:xyloglucanase [Gaeumannomyces tritici R3-111a-1]EJT80148.1 xyloglucanase [Gaeumannomyces tritici R3-111a-1]